MRRGVAAGVRWLTVLVTASLVLTACGGSNADPARFCELDAEIDLSDVLDAPPAFRPNKIDEFRELMDELVGVAPDEISEAVKIGREVTDAVMDALEDVDYDLDRLEEDFWSDFYDNWTTEELDTVDLADQWVETNCF